jgi:hypothetical protein
MASSPARGWSVKMIVFPSSSILRRVPGSLQTRERASAGVHDRQSFLVHDDDRDLLGAYALERLRLAVDPIARRLASALGYCCPIVRERTVAARTDSS